jgi:hypothetical protein
MDKTIKKCKGMVFIKFKIILTSEGAGTGKSHRLINS